MKKKIKEIVNNANALNTDDFKIIAECIGKTRIEISIDEMSNATRMLGELKNKCLAYSENDADVNLTDEEKRNIVNVISNITLTGTITNLPDKIARLVRIAQKVAV